MLDFEKDFKESLIAGIDEAGRGPLAGPLVCACVIMPKTDLIEGINDSKKLSPKKREELFEQIVQTALAYSIIEIDEKTIDELNILNATKLGMKKALEALAVKPEIVFTDAVQIETDLPQKNIIHGDGLSYNIAAASILAKVHRDRLMQKLSLQYPQYQFAQHKGYGTKLHIEKLKEFGPCPLHRKSFLKNFTIMMKRLSFIKKRN